MSSGLQQYEDATVVCDDGGITIRRYYPWGSKFLPYSKIIGISELKLRGGNRARKWRLWGTGDFVHWWSLDGHRPVKSIALVIDDGHRIRPTFTPDDPLLVERVVGRHLG